MTLEKEYSIGSHTKAAVTDELHERGIVLVENFFSIVDHHKVVSRTVVFIEGKHILSIEYLNPKI